MKYKRILNKNGPVATQTIQNVKRMVRKNKIADGEFLCIAKCGNIHVWTIKTELIKLKKKDIIVAKATFVKVEKNRLVA
jgi:hypothetical protein